MASSTGTPTMQSIGIKNSNIETAPGVDLSDQQKVIVGSILDLFEGNPTLKHLSLWSRGATFSDPITIATGFDKFAAQWYGLVAVFRPIALQSHRVTSAGNPIEFDMKNKYTVRGIGKEQVVESQVRVFLGDDGKIEKVEDRWNGKLPDGAVSEVSAFVERMKQRTVGGGRGKVSNGGHGEAGISRGSPLEGLLGRAVFLPVDLALMAVDTIAEWAFTGFCTVAWWRPFWAFRKLNAVTVPTLVTVPKTKEEDMRMKAEREGQK